MRVILLGAGASSAACYPVSSQLMEAVKAEAEGPSGRNQLLSSDWKKWQSFKGGAHGAARALLCDPNPEVVLSFLDLCAESETQIVAKPMKSGVASEARASFLRCLEYYFQVKHIEDSKSRWRRNYLRPFLAKLSPGDMVITLNWDTTIERTLYEDGGWRRWNPVTGYGFRKKLRGGIGKPGIAPQARLSRKLAAQSEIRVLKLHGSVGWYEAVGENLYFGKDYFLDWFNFPREASLFHCSTLWRRVSVRTVGLSGRILHFSSNFGERKCAAFGGLRMRLFARPRASKSGVTLSQRATAPFGPY